MGSKHRHRAVARSANPRSFVTAAEVACVARVSRSAVSRTFTPGASVSRQIRERVIKAADRLGYRVNRLAQGLIRARSNLVGIVGTTIGMPFHATLLAGLSEALLSEDFDCMLFNAANAERDLGTIIERVLEYRVSAIVVMSGMPPSWIVEKATASGVPVILINKSMPKLMVDSVVSDHVAGGRAAAQQLIGAGCRNLAVVSSADRTFSLLGRIRGFRNYAGGVGVAVTLWEEGPTSYETGQNAARALAATGRIDAAFCVTDIIALGFLDAARRDLGMRVPEDLSVIGFDDIPQAGWGSYRLTTFRQDVPDLARAVIAALNRRMHDATARPDTTVLRAKLIERETVAGARQPIEAPIALEFAR